jgi:hypothetical protein
MGNVKINTITITGKKRFKEFNLTSITISNHNNAEATFSLNGVKRTLPAISGDFNVPVAPFRIENCGHSFDIDLQFLANATNVVIDYIQLANTSKNCQ